MLGVVLLALSYMRLVGDLGSAAFNIQIVKSALEDPLWNTRLGLNIGLFALAMLALHMAAGFVCWVMAVLSGLAFSSASCTRRQWVVIWYLLGLACLVIANATFFPHSSLGEPYRAMAQARLLGLSPLALVCGFTSLAVLAVLVLSLRRPIARRWTWTVAGVGVLATASGFGWRAFAAPVRADVPNIILLGVDSLRPDAVTPELTPNIYAFMDGAMQMSDAVTPLARTFPSWVSILTGRHPHTTGAYMNLLPEELIHTGTTLPQLLRQHGYRTYYAIDETRFSNIDASYGFDHTATPAIGGTDFVLSWFADTPLSNMVVNTQLGALLFPHVHANRAAHVTYYPDSFVRKVGREFDFNQPVFVAMHLTLPHWPFNWATSSGEEPNNENLRDMYRASVHAADQQVGDLLALLRQRGVLDNAVVVVLSDHGEGLGQPDDLIPGVFPQHGDEEDQWVSAQKWGHGTSVFSPHQYRVLLGIRGYGATHSLLPHAGTLHAPVSLVDLAPTILDLLDLKSSEPFDGQSLLPLLRSGVESGEEFKGRIRFTESEYNPQGFSVDHVTASALATAAKVYRLDPRTDRITVRPDLIHEIVSTRQYAAMMDGSFAAALPPKAGGHTHHLVYEPRAGNHDPREQAVLRQALEKRFGIQLDATTSELKPQP
jgi:arylsulfatase A-like enzyme